MTTLKRSSKKISPIKAPPLRQPGQSLAQEVKDLIEKQWMSWTLISLVSLGIAVIEWYRLYLHDRPTLASALIYSVMALLLATFTAFKIWRTIPKLKALKQGMRGEQVVGQFLDEYCRERHYKVFHDLLADGFNIDHILVGKGGVFTVNTKTISKPTVGEPVVTYDGGSVNVDGYTPDRDPVRQARAEADHVRDLLAELTGRKRRDIPVRPVVLYPGWYIEGSSSGKDVWVLNPKAFIGFLDNEDEHVSSEDVALFSSRLANSIRHAKVD